MVFILFAAGVFSFNALAADQAEQVIKITAKRFEYSPNVITIKAGMPVIL